MSAVKVALSALLCLVRTGGAIKIEKDKNIKQTAIDRQ